MYTTFYGLKEPPFNLTPDPEFLYLGEKHREALAHLIYGLNQKKGFMVITGEVGTGKTTLIHCFLNHLNNTNGTKAAFLFNPKLGTADFIRSILRDFGLPADGGTKGDFLHTLNEYLLEQYKKGEKVVLIIDEAQGLSQSLLEEIRLLSNLETSKSKLLQILLVGQPELNQTLARQEFRQIRQRINMHYHLTALSEKETQEYIEKRLKVAGARGPLFTKGGMKEIYRNSQGIPRLINILCDNSLLSGYASDRAVIDKRSVKEAAKDLKLGGRFPKFWLWLLPAIVIVICLASYFLLQESGYWRTIFTELLPRLQSLKDIVTDAINGFLKISNF
jgi:general secretion pathway protein A